MPSYCVVLLTVGGSYVDYRFLPTNGSLVNAVSRQPTVAIRRQEILTRNFIEFPIYKLGFYIRKVSSAQLPHAAFGQIAHIPHMSQLNTRRVF